MLTEYKCNKCSDWNYFKDLEEAIKNMCPRCGSKELITWDDEDHSPDPEPDYDNGGYEDEDD